MKISYNWLKEYLPVDLPPKQVSDILTNIGLEVEGVETFQAVKGGLEGVVIGEVIECTKHPNADKLSITSVNVGNDEPLQIVCGAPNVAEGQKVPVALVGSILYPDEKGFTIKKTKIRGELSLGMICAEDELGLGSSHEGIMVLDPGTLPGTPASEYFKLESDTVFEIGLTPNRIDAASHLGVARDLAAYLKQKSSIELTLPSIEGFAADKLDLPVSIEIREKDACPRYSGLTISGVKVGESPDWLKNRLLSIGLSPINNVVDITNYVLHESGQPLHAFDMAQITGNKVLVQTMPEGTKFTTLDEVERTLLPSDLMICNDQEGMCIAGVFGGIKSGVSETTTDVFLESACFDPVYVRKTSKHHVLFTDASFRFERGSDPNMTVWALKRAAMLIKEVAGGSISSEVIDVYPEAVKNFEVSINYDHVNRLIGNPLNADTIRSILESLEIAVIREDDTGMVLSIPPYRVDVQREADVIEEILRIYGFNNVETGSALQSTLSYSSKPDREKVINQVSDLLSAEGFFEMKSNSLSKSAYYEKEETPDPGVVRLFNPLSQDLSAMRKNLLYGGLEAIAYNINRRNSDLRLYEFGNCYFLDPEKAIEQGLKKFDEQLHMGIYLSGQSRRANWIQQESASSFYELKKHVEKVLLKLGIDPFLLEHDAGSDPDFSESVIYSLQGKEIVLFGSVSSDLLEGFDIKQAVYAAEFNWDHVLKLHGNQRILFQSLPRFQVVNRDLSLLLDRTVTYEKLRNLAFMTEKKLLRQVSLFDVYEGDKIKQGKKSYALSFVLLDEAKTLTDKQIDKVMRNLATAFEREFGAKVRGTQ